MSLDITRQAAALIDHIQTRFHDGHRQDLPPLLALASAAQQRGIADGLADELRAIGNALERHMFKEEMRLFPMMEQGGNTLIGQLIADLQCEHREHELAIDGLRARLALLGDARHADPALLPLIQGIDAFAVQLTRHIRTEDEELFALFTAPDASR